MKIKKILVWSAIHGSAHKSLSENEKKICGFMPLLSILFPGIDYYSMSGFHQVMNDLAKPVLRKLFPELITANEEQVDMDEVEVSSFLPSVGYEWQDNPAWRKEFEGLLA